MRSVHLYLAASIFSCVCNPDVFTSGFVFDSNPINYSPRIPASLSHANQVNYELLESILENKKTAAVQRLEENTNKTGTINAKQQV